MKHQIPEVPVMDVTNMPSNRGTVNLLNRAYIPSNGNSQVLGRLWDDAERTIAAQRQARLASRKSTAAKKEKPARVRYAYD